MIKSSRLLDCFALLLWGVVATGFVLTGRISSYLHPSFHLWTLVSGVTLVGLALILIILPTPSWSCCSCSEPNSPALHWLKSATLILPLTLTVAISPSQFGAVTVRNRGLADSLSSLPGFSAYRQADLPWLSPGSQAGEFSLEEMFEYDQEGRLEVTLLDLLYAANIPEFQKAFSGKQLAVVGQFLPPRGQSPPSNQFSLVRMFILCCAADARPLALPVIFPEAMNLPEMSWVRVSGVAKFTQEEGQTLPVIEAQQVEPCETPSETFLY